MDTTDPWVRVAGTALSIIRGRHTPENAIISGWTLLVEAGARAGLAFPPELDALERLRLPVFPICGEAFDLQEQSLAQDAARLGRRAG
jgi:hypothetical protein